RRDAPRRGGAGCRPASLKPAAGSFRRGGEMAGEVGDARVLEHDLRIELAAEPFLEANEEMDRGAGIEAEPGEIGLRHDLLGREIEVLAQIIKTELADFGFAAGQAILPGKRRRGVTNSRPRGRSIPGPDPGIAARARRWWDRVAAGRGPMGL